MELTGQEVMNAYFSLDWVTAQKPLNPETQKPDSRETLRIGRLFRAAIREIGAEANLLEACKKDLFVKYEAVQDERGRGEWNFPKGNQAEYERERQTLMREKVVIDVKPIKLSEVVGLPWNVGHMSALEWLIVDDTKESVAAG